MDLILSIHIVALLFSFFVVGTILGAAFSKSIRGEIAALLRLEYLSSLLSLDKSSHNPILKPGTSPWTAEAVLNPAAIVLDGRTHLVYRAIGMDGVSRLGYASSADGIVFDERLPYPIYAAQNPGGVAEHQRRYSPVMYPSGGSWGGVEDPRMVAIDNRVYVTFNMFENWLLRVGVISMSKEDFLNKRFEKWEGPYIISNTAREKNWMLFPEKIGGRFAVLTGIIDPDDTRVRIEYTDDLKTLSRGTFEAIDPQKVSDRPIAWHVHVRSAGPPPIKTDKGWLVFYHAQDTREPSHYKLGAMLLDLDDPTKILYRAPMPVLSPSATYENVGKPGVVYACGAVIRDGKIFVYYGGADKVVCVATAPIDAFLDALVAGSEPSLTTILPVQTT
ncbi:MAG: hypothetical protein WCW36_01320 [Candidatus Paceibacterota bacterium]|jgi:predicted GH43/DUF377 family glycosyl hydrolase